VQLQGNAAAAAALLQATSFERFRSGRLMLTVLWSQLQWPWPLPWLAGLLIEVLLLLLRHARCMLPLATTALFLLIYSCVSRAQLALGWSLQTANLHAGCLLQLLVTL
jgi:hypothetical protein